MDGVVEVVGPLARQAVAGGLLRAEHDRVVQVRLGDERERTPDELGVRLGLRRHRLQHVRAGGVADRVHGVEAEPVDVVVAEPHPDVVEHVPADLGVLDVDRVAPRVAESLQQVRAVQRQVVAARAEVVVDDVLDDPESQRVGGVDETVVGVGTAVGVVHGEPTDTVVAPVPLTVDGVDGEQLDELHAELDEVVELRGRRIERALGRVGADVHLVDHTAAGGTARPGLVGPGEALRVDDLGRTVHPVRLVPAAGVGSDVLVVVDAEAVACADDRGDLVGAPPVVVTTGQRVLDVVDDQAHALRVRCPDGVAGGNGHA